jgi:hypothetical protein
MFVEQGYMLMNFLHNAAVSVQGCDKDVCDLENTIPTVKADSGQVSSILQIVFMVIGVVALVYLIIAGLKLITSLGNPEALKESRQSIIFAVVGLAVALSAEIIVTTVLKNL